MQYIATINTPGYLPDGDDGPAVFDTPGEAWAYLWDEHRAAWEEAEGEIPLDSSTTFADVSHRGTVGTVTLATPGYDGDHDLGKAYSVTARAGVTCVDCGAVFENEDVAQAHWDEVHDR